MPDSAELSVPTGGGALSGIGETFQPDLHTGTGNLSVPIPLPPGRRGLSPSLALAYSTGAPNGPFGLGWSLAVPRVSRRTDLGLPTYHDDQDTFVLSGAEELRTVPLGTARPAAPDGLIRTRYRPRTEAGFARTLHITGGNSDYWEVRSPDGLTSYYGTGPSGGLAAGTDPAVITRPGGGIFSWLLTETVDPLGNRIVYDYRSDPDGGPQRYLSRVRYADYGDPANPSYLVSVQITYPTDPDASGNYRPDPFSSRAPGFELRTTLRATTITISTTQAGATDPTTATTIALRYADELGQPASNAVSLLRRITITGHDGPATQDLPPLEFSYSDWQPDNQQFQLLTGELPPSPLGSAGLDLVDLFGDGLPSLVQLNGTIARYWRNRGNLGFDLPRSLANTPTGGDLTTAGVFLTDLDGDGRANLALTSPTRTQTWSLAAPNGQHPCPGFDPDSYHAGAAPTVTLSDPQLRLIDLDRDHKLDVLRAGGPNWCATGDGKGGFAGLRPVPSPPDLPVLDFTDPRIHLADMTGDGAMDIVLIHNSALTYWPNDGHGLFGAPVHMHNPPTFTDTRYPGVGYDPRRLLLGDVVGDGCADVIYVDAGQVHVWVNESGNGFAKAPLTVAGTPQTTDLTSVRLTDFTGSGVSGVLWSNIGANQRWAFLDLTGGIKPYLLTGIDNHAGAHTTIDYATSTHYATADREAGRPWQTTLPFPVHVVAATTTVDTFANTTLTSAFTYHDGYWDPLDREFRGFAQVEQTDTLSPVGPPTPAPCVVEPVDSLAASSGLPDGFDPAAAGNLLANWSFDTASGLGPTTLSTTADHPSSAGQSAAASWTTWNNAATTTTTELVPSTMPYGKDGSSIHVTTGGTGCGVVQTFRPQHTGPDQVLSSAWIYIVRGSVAIGTGDGGNTHGNGICSDTGRWLLLQAGNGTSPANELTIYAAAPDGAEFYVDHAWVTEPAGPAEPLADSPPVRTVTWFHVGPVALPNGTWSVLNPLDQYWPRDLPLTDQLDLSLLTAADGAPSPAEVAREALRALRGRVLRTELYADDESARAALPYEVHDNSYQLAPVLDGQTVTDWHDAPVVTVRPVHTRVSVWERGDEPMTRLQTSGRYDSYGRPAAVVDAAAPRERRDPRAPGAGCLATVTVTDHATRDDPDHYIIDRVTRTVRNVADDDGTRAVTDFTTAALDGSLAGELRGVTRTYYDGDPFTGLDPGQLGEHGLPVRTEQLALTPDILTAACAAGPTGSAILVPPYLHTDGTTDWPVEYPAAFRAAVLDDAPASRGTQLGYTWHPDSPTGYYVQTSRLCYDVQTGAGRGLVTISRDPYGGDTTTSYDRYSLLPRLVTDPAGLSTGAAYDNRVLKPNLITDPNGNQTAIGYTPLGLTAWTSSLGKPASGEGDTPDLPTVSFIYDLTASDNSPSDGRRPMNVTTVRRVEHQGNIVAAENARHDQAGQPALTQAEITARFTNEPADHFVRTTQYSDGFGRLLQTRTQSQTLTIDPTAGLGLPDDPDTPVGTATATIADPAAPPVVVSGWTVYDNKGRSIVTFEPYLDTGYNYLQPDDTRLAALARTRYHYDPRGLLIRSVAADRSESRVIPGRPLPPIPCMPRSLATPLDDYLPTPWESYAYDPSDNAARTHPTGSLQAAGAWNTPTSNLFDALGRTATATARTTDPTTGELVELTTTTTYDIDGHPLTVTDPLGRLGAQTLYDLAGQPIRSWLLDAGTNHTIRDATGAPVEQRDDNGALTLAGFDPAHRPRYGWAADTAGVAATLRLATVYGDDPTESGLNAQQAADDNALGRVVLALDETGQVTTSGYDLDGNPRSTSRRVLDPQNLLDLLPTAAGASWANTNYRVDWQPANEQTLSAHATPLLDTTDYTTDTTFDALGRLTAQTDPTGASGARAARQLDYTPSGAIASVTVDGVIYLGTVIYDAHGRRQLAVTGNGLLTRYQYDPRTFRLARQHTIKAAADTSQPITCTWTPTTGATALQDSSLRYDLAGNLTTLAERSPGCGLAPTPDALDRRFGYDPLHQLISATGRETDTRPDPPWRDPCTLPGQDLTKTRAYAQSYRYDHVGNLLELAHHTPTVAGGGYTRSYTPAADNNRLTRLDTGGNKTADYLYDACGNLTAETDSRLLEWDHAHRLVTYRTQPTPTTEPSVYAQYRYDATGTRVFKLLRRQGGLIELSVYLGGFERILTLPSPGGALTRHDITHVDGGTSRLAEIHTGDPLRDDGLDAHPVRYQHADHLTSVTTTCSDTGDSLNREEYSPYGETTFGSYTRKRYRHTGRERDEESSLGYYSARYYAPWLARWVSTDPARNHDGWTPYTYVRNTPMTLTDPTGMSAEPDVSNAGATTAHGEVLDAGPASVESTGPNKNIVNFADPTPEGSHNLAGPAEQDSENPDLYVAGTVNGRTFYGKLSDYEMLKRQEAFEGFKGELSKVGTSLIASVVYTITSFLTRDGGKQQAAIDFAAAAAVFAAPAAQRVATAMRGRPELPHETSSLQPPRDEASELHVPTDRGPAAQSESESALRLRSEARAGGTIYRAGDWRRGSRTGEGQFWAFETPLKPGFAEKYGAATLSGESKNWIIAGMLKPGTGFVTRESPPANGNPGGAVELVCPANSIFLKYFHIPGY